MFLTLHTHLDLLGLPCVVIVLGLVGILTGIVCGFVSAFLGVVRVCIRILVAILTSFVLYVVLGGLVLLAFVHHSSDIEKAVLRFRLAAPVCKLRFRLAHGWILSYLVTVRPSLSRTLNVPRTTGAEP
jgi:hypothetical protein